MSTISFSGLSSGLDTTSLISSLVAAERAPVTQITSEQQDLNTQKSILGSMSSDVAALNSAITAMNLPTLLQPRTASSSDSHVTATASSGAAATVHNVTVKQLARGQIDSSKTFTSNTAGVAGTGQFTIGVGTNSAQISYGANDTLDDIATKINSANLGVAASVLFDGSSYRLMVASNQTGTANAPTFTEQSGNLGLSDPKNVKVAAQDAIANIDGVDVTRSTNVISDAVTGVTFTLNSAQGANDPASQVTVGLDTTAITNQLNSLVSAYNSINGALHVQLDYTGSTKGTDTLFGDPTLMQLQNSLASVMTAQYGPNSSAVNSLAALGISVDKTGAMTLDTTKLTSALQSNPNAVSDVFITGGFAKALTDLTNAYTDPASGFLTTASQSLTDRSNQLQTQADQINANADALQTTLQNQFNNLETLMSSLKNQSSFLSSAFK